MSEYQTIGERLENACLRVKAGKYKGQDYMGPMRFDKNTRHMVVYNVLTDKAWVGAKGDRMRMFFSEEKYKEIVADEKKGNVKIITHAAVKDGHLRYDRDKKQVR